MGEKPQNILEFFGKLNHPVSKKYLINEVKREWSGIWKTLFFLPFLSCFVLFLFVFFFLLSHKKVVLQIIGVFDHIYYIIRFFFNWMNLTIC